MTGPSSSFNIVVCASGGGGNFQALIDMRESLGVVITKLVVDRPCGAMKRAEDARIPYVSLSKIAGEAEFLESFISEVPAATDLIVLAGFMPILPRSVCAAWPGRIINTHPSLLPKYGGRGMYGVRVQEAVIAAGEKVAGCTIHYVNETIDGGAIILQRAINIIDGETPWQLGGRIHVEEKKLLIEAIRLIKGASAKEITGVQDEF
jgi:phosphoribosylglycinamide formyltransferase-1